MRYKNLYRKFGFRKVAISGLALVNLVNVSCTPNLQEVVDSTLILSQTPYATPAPTSVSECSDGRDNDGDGCVDYPEDNQCESSEDNREDFDIDPEYPGGLIIQECF